MTGSPCSLVTPRIRLLRNGKTHLLHLVREVLFTAWLGEFLAVADLQAGSDWEARLDAEAGRSALLMVRTDRYAGREDTTRGAHGQRSGSACGVALCGA